MVDVATTQSFSEAAKRAHLTQPAVSRAVREVERVLDTQLFTRTTRSVMLTGDGGAFLPLAREILHGYDTAMERFGAYRRGQRGELSLAALPSLAAGPLAPLIASYVADHLLVHVTLRTGSADQLLAAVRDGQADLALTEDPGPECELDRFPIFTDPTIALLPIDHPFTRLRRLRWHDLAALPLIQLTPGTSVRRLTDRGFAGAGVTPRVAVSVDAVPAAAALVAAGVGATAIARSALSLIAKHGFVVMPLEEPEISLTIAVVSRTSPKLSSVAYGFIGLLRRGLGSQG